VSLILDALNRSRDNDDPVPNLTTHHPVEPIPSRARHYLPWVILSIAILLVLWLVIERFTGTSTPEADIGAPVAELSQNIGSVAASVTSELKARAAAHEKATEWVPAESPAEVSVASPVAAVLPQARPASTSERPDSASSALAPVKTNSAVARLYQNKDVSENSADQTQTSPTGPDASRATPEEQPINIEEVLQRAQEDVGKAALVDHPAPFLTHLSQRTKDDIPTLYYQRHDYSPEPSNSSVVLNGKQVKVGGSPLSGMKVDEILQDSVVLSYRGTQFRLRSLNSWVNL
jgi:general secretion pathway protein B